MLAIAKLKKEFRDKLDILDIELILSSVINKPREYILAHPEHQITSGQEKKINKLLQRRMEHEPLAYILGHKEFYGLEFKINKDTLIPRPETEMIVEHVTWNLERQKSASHDARYAIIDIGTGSGNIIISIVKELEEQPEFQASSFKFYGTDISPKALLIAKYNTKKHQVDKKIKFIHSDLLDYFLKNKKLINKNTNLIITANLPYLSSKIYSRTIPDVKNFEPKIALLSPRKGLAHYEKLFQQIKILLNTFYTIHTTVLIEISPEQKSLIQKIIRKTFPKAKLKFHKDLARKWRIAELNLY